MKLVQSDSKHAIFSFSKGPLEEKGPLYKQAQVFLKWHNSKKKIKIVDNARRHSKSWLDHHCKATFCYPCWIRFYPDLKCRFRAQNCVNCKHCLRGKCSQALRAMAFLCVSRKSIFPGWEKTVQVHQPWEDSAGRERSATAADGPRLPTASSKVEPISQRTARMGGGWFSPNLYRLGCSFLVPPSWPRDSVLWTGLVSFQCISYIGGHTAHLLGQMGF